MRFPIRNQKLEFTGDVRWQMLQDGPDSSQYHSIWFAPVEKHWLYPALDQRRWPPRPGLAFVLGDGFHILHIYAGLREHVVQIVADADECEVLFQELPHAPSPEKE